MRIKAAYLSSFTAKKQRIFAVSYHNPVSSSAISKHISFVASQSVWSYSAQQFSVSEALQLEKQ